MCTGVEIAAIAALAGGTHLQAQSQGAKQRAFSEQAEAQGRIARRQQEAAWDEMQQQHALEKQRRDALQEALPGVERGSQEANLDEAAASRADLLKQVVARPEDGDGGYQSPATDDAPRVIKSHRDKRRDEADDFISLMGDARARLGAWGDSMFGSGQQLNDLGFNVGELNRQARSSGQLHQAQDAVFNNQSQLAQQAAQMAYQNTGNKRALGGNLLSSLGQMGLMHGGANAQPSPANYQGAGFAGSSGNFAADYGASSLGNNFYLPGGRY